MFEGDIKTGTRTDDNYGALYLVLNMNPNEDIRRHEDDKTKQKRPHRRGGPASMPRPDNVAAIEEPTQPSFRAMAIPNRKPKLLFTPPSDRGVLKSGEQLDWQNRKFQPADRGEFVLNMEAQPLAGWDLSQATVENIPMYFPREMIQFEFPRKHLPDVLERISVHFRDSSVQVSFREQPLSAKLQTCREITELYLVFFQSSNGSVSMSVQRHKGDHTVANRCIQRLVQAAKGISGEDCDSGNNSDCAVTAESIMAMEHFIERCVAENKRVQSTSHDSDNTHPYDSFLNQTPEETTENAIREVHSLLEKSNRFDLRRRALENILAMTDLNRTLKSTAVATSRIVLQGSERKFSSNICAKVGIYAVADTIQSILLSILMTRELPGDRLLLPMTVTEDSEKDMDLELRPYFPEVDKDVAAAAAGLPRYYTEYMNELFNLVLQILVQSLEVAAFFPDGDSVVTNQLLLAATTISGGKDLYDILLGCVRHSESKIANGCLACKALRLLASNNAFIKDQINRDEIAKQSIKNAYQIGQKCHKLLKDESYELW
eukprot:CAMPEP_0201207720 /NCGR_PEP_ID=MMETSP0851-20130426/174992_1 /ASSEMBLY_ACC=CAM_ASM_000631 /TAXON_ID=183588 /ORGANISM="Pseudo-nitzschia fraudulenta, Strain WWA7" /LENGTH=545 /DNA_ID=CAMNT_0047496191 /DNA_START=59 /DNA_END=1693 /DNA_ORIENTATION=-